MCIVVCCCTVNAQQTTGRVHAIIISGGMNKLMNHERYWNDCSFLYRTLSQTYRVPKRNIIVLMSDGGDPEEDMLKADARDSPPRLSTSTVTAGMMWTILPQNRRWPLCF